MSRHRADPPPRSLPRLPHPQLPSPLTRRHVAAAGVVTTLVAGGVVAGLWPDGGGPGQVQGIVAADALTGASSLRTEERSSRDRERSLLPSASATATATASAPTPAPTATKAAAPKVVGKVWVTLAVNVRSGPSAAEARIGSLKAAGQVRVTGATKAGWTQVVIEEGAGWVRSTYLSKDKPEPVAKTTTAGVSDASCSISADVEKHLTANATAVYRAVCAAYGDEVSSFGGYRAGDDGDHGTGRAVDIMVSGDPGKDIARYVQAHAKELHVTYVIYQQRIWMAGDPVSSWKLMEDRGSTTANHYDHVHVSVS